MPASPPIKSIINTIPKKPGVYHFYDENDNIIYIGKSKRSKKKGFIILF